MKLILASQSEGRRKVLEEAGYSFEIKPSDFDESQIEHGEHLNLENYVKELAAAKAMVVAFEIDDGIVIGADTVVDFNGTLLEKPKDKKDAVRMLTMLSKNWHEVITGIAVINAETREKVIDSVKSRLKFREITKEEIQDYVNTGEPLSKAGAYDIAGRAKDFVEKIEGSRTNILGLPAERISEILKTMTSSE